MAAELDIRPGDARDTDRALDLVRASLGEGLIPRSREYWEWKHHRNPFGESAVLLAESDGRLVGLRVYMRWEWRRGDRTYRAVRAVDTATHPDWQGRGIFSRLTKALAERMRDEGVNFIFNTPNEKSRPGYLKMGWTAVGRTDLAIAPVRPLRLARAALERGRGTAAPDVAGTPIPAPDGAVTAADLCEHPALPALLEAAERGARDGLHTPRSLDYVRWRYADVPGFSYHALLDGDGADGAALVFRYKRRGPLVEARICDCFVGDSARSAQTAARLIVRLQRTAGADYLSVMPTARRPGPVGLALRGILPAHRLGPILTVRSLNEPPDGAALASRAHWNPSIGDLELF